VPRFLTQEWVDAFNAAIAGVGLPDPGPDAGLAAADGRFTVVQEVRGGPDGDVRLVLRTADGALELELQALEPMSDASADGDVTIALDYADAVSLAQGGLSPGEALSAGRIRVRGDLSVLSAGQELLRAARAHTLELDSATTY
jgi:ubiquinone biosynthesis protein UbiJ